jgi:DNA-binding CsgD family transcriptional regulator
MHLGEDIVTSMEFVDARADALDAAHQQLLGRSEQLRRALGDLSIRQPATCWSYAHGLAHLARRLERDAAECRSSVWHLSPGPLLEAAAAVVPAELRAASSAVDVRCAMPASALTQKPWLKLCLGRYSGVLLAPVLQRILLLDRSVVVFPGPLLPRGTETFMATSHPDALELTELLWRETERVGSSLRSRRPDRMEERRMSVLTELCRGSTDGQIARQLGVSVRLVEMDIQHLKSLCGAGNRTQLVARLLVGDG